FTLRLIMKQILLLLMLSLAVNFAADAQNRKMGGNDKIEQLEKLRLIEILNLDEETSIRFFTRHSEFKKVTEDYHTRLDNQIKVLDELIKNGNQSSSAEYKKQINEYWKTESELVNERKKFYDSLSNLLTDEQIAKLIVFERHFRDEIRHILMKNRLNGKKH
ncbi:MAG: hypothetical protein K8H86_01135, partial [Ignavibacteriaceae bacterium]|nr:hypothetical protein [Ignavibacteriaceae bacterium]